MVVSRTAGSAGFQAIVHNESSAVTAADDGCRQKYTPLPDYSVRNAAFGKSAADEAKADSAAWKSFAAVAGSAMVMGMIYLAAAMLQTK